MKPAALLFDMDGLLLDTEAISVQCWKQVALEHGYELTPRLLSRFVGLAQEERQQIFFEEYGADFPFESIYNERMALGDKFEVEQGIPIKEGAEELLEFVASQNIPLAIGTGTLRERVVRRLKAAGLLKYFPVIVTSEVVPGKPAPDIYLRAAELLGANPTECIVLEDAPPGIHSALAADMRFIVVPDLIPTPPELLARAYFVGTTLREVRVFLETTWTYPHPPALYRLT